MLSSKIIINISFVEPPLLINLLLGLEILPEVQDSLILLCNRGMLICSQHNPILVPNAVENVYFAQ